MNQYEKAVRFLLGLAFVLFVSVIALTVVQSQPRSILEGIPTELHEDWELYVQGDATAELGSGYFFALNKGSITLIPGASASPLGLGTSETYFLYEGPIEQGRWILIEGDADAVFEGDGEFVIETRPVGIAIAQVFAGTLLVAFLLWVIVLLLTAIALD